MKRSFNVIGIIVSVIAVIVMTVCLMILGFQRPIVKTLEKENLTEVMEKIDIERIFRDEKGNTTKMGYRIYGYFDKIGLSNEEVDMVVKDKKFKVIIGNYLSTMFLNGITGVEVIYPTRGELVSFIHNNYTRFQHVTGFPKDYKEAKITEIVNNNYSNVKKELDELAKDIKFDQIKNIDLLKKVMSINSWLLIGIIIACAVILLLFRKLFKSLRLASISGFINGIFFLFLGLFGSNLMSSFIDLKDYKSLLEPIIENISKNMLIYGILLIALSIIALVVSFFIKPKTVKEEIKDLDNWF